MSRKKYSFIDLCVMPELRDHIVAEHGAVLFSENLEQVIWANSEGAKLLNISPTGDTLDNLPAWFRSTIRQIHGAVEQLQDEPEVTAMMRLRAGFNTKMLPFTVKHLSATGLKEAVLLITERQNKRPGSVEDMAQAAVDCLNDDTVGAAVLDHKANVIASSKRFGGLKISDKVVGALVSEVATEDDSLVKRAIRTTKGNKPSAIARLDEEGTYNLLIVADEGDLDPPAAKKAAPMKKPTAEPKLKKEQAPEEEEVQETARVGAFSSKRIPVGQNGLGKWYYKAGTTGTEDSSEAPDSPADKAAKELAAKGKPEKKKVAATPKSKATTVAKKKASISKNAPSDGKAKKADKSKTKAAVADDEAPVVSAGTLVQEVDHTPIKGEDDATRSATRASVGLDDEEADAFEFAANERAVRFIWEMDADNVFTSVSDELAQTLGPEVARLEGLSWAEACTLHQIAEREEIETLLDKCETWSGKTALWPVQGTDLRVPIDLAGLPSYGRNRKFAGFNGFGIIRTTDAIVDTGEDASEPLDQNDSISNVVAHEVVEEAPANNVISSEEAPANSKALTDEERDTFDEIREKLGDEPIVGRAQERSEPESDAKPADRVITPSAFVRQTKITIPEHDVDTSILSRLPIPVLVYRDNELLFGNREFFQVTGYSSLQQLADAGGVETLFGGDGPDGEDIAAAIYDRHGQVLDMQPNIQRVPWDAEKAMLLTLRRNNPRDRFQRKDNPSSDDHGQARELDASDDAATSTDQPASVGRVPMPDESNVTSINRYRRNRSDAFGGLSKEELRNILDTASDGVIVLSPEGEIRAINQSAEALFDAEPDAVLGQDFTTLLASESRKEAQEYLASVSEPGIGALINDGREVIGKTAKGGLVPLSMTIGRLNDSESCCAILRDITQRKLSEDELTSARKEAEFASNQKSAFLAKISHEVRTPLNAIIGFSEIMLEERFGAIANQRYRGYLRDINRSGNHVLDLINDLLDISKIEAGELDLEFDACDLNSIASETIALSQPQANKQQVIVRTSLSNIVPKVVADERSLRQIILNLVTNGIKFTKAGGQVIVSTVYDESGEVVLRVRDTGVGMSAEQLKTAMKPFVQLHTTGPDDSKGSGLGLPLTKAMVEANRAQLNIESTPGEGTLAEVYFPPQRVLADR